MHLCDHIAGIWGAGDLHLFFWFGPTAPNQSEQGKPNRVMPRQDIKLPEPCSYVIMLQVWTSGVKLFVAALPILQAIAAYSAEGGVRERTQQAAFVVIYWSTMTEFSSRDKSMSRDGVRFQLGGG